MLKYLLSKDLFREVVSAGFAQKRKTILNNLKNYLKDKENNRQSFIAERNRIKSSCGNSVG